MANPLRPTSPHLGIYRWQITMVLSILHRMTDVALFVGTALIVIWLWSSAYAPAYYSTLHAVLASGVGQLLLLGWTVAFYFHLGNGIRHLFWDMGKGFSIPRATLSGWLVILFTMAMTCLTLGAVLGQSDNGCLSEHPPTGCEKINNKQMGSL